MEALSQNGVMMKTFTRGARIQGDQISTTYIVIV